MLSNCQGSAPLELLVVIVNRGRGSKVLKVARQNGVSGGTIALGRGTYRHVKSFWLDSNDIRKDIVLMLGNEDKLLQAIQKIDEELEMAKPNHGIGFLIDIRTVMGSMLCRVDDDTAEKGEDKAVMQAIFTIVENGSAETVVKAAEAAGSRGATIINARGAGVHETAKLFAMDVEPEKEIVLILAENSTAPAIIESIRRETGLDEPGRGLLFAMDVSKTFGMLK